METQFCNCIKDTEDGADVNGNCVHCGKKHGISISRPKMANEAIELLKDGQPIEIEIGKVFDFFRYVGKAERNFKLSCNVNEFNDGYAVLRKIK
jgi:hypothetical protein